MKQSLNSPKGRSDRPAAAEPQHSHLDRSSGQSKSSSSDGGGVQESSSSDDGGLKGEDAKGVVDTGRRSLRPAPSTFHGILKPLITLAPFVPKMLKDRICANQGGKYSAFDTASMRSLVGASQTLSPSMDGVQLAMMIADVKGFTALTETLSKKGASIKTLPPLERIEF